VLPTIPKIENQKHPEEGTLQEAREPQLLYSTRLGGLYLGLAENALTVPRVRSLRKKVKLIFTSPPFPLNRKKKYGNLQGRKYLLWLSTFAEDLTDFLHPRGSIVIEIGNAWEPGLPTFSTLPVEALLEFKRAGALHLCQEFISYNPAKLPTPAQWVTVDRTRVKDAFTRLWWMSPTVHPDARNTRVLSPYSEDMRKLLASKKYNAGVRPSEHKIGAKSFLRDNRGSIPPNVLTVANTGSTDPYLRFCRKEKLEFHPARMPVETARFFVKFLTRPGDYVLDPFAGSNVTGAVAEELGRRWISVETNLEYAAGSLGRFRTSSGLTINQDQSAWTAAPQLRARVLRATARW
jgi:site-specific DNA-methyltransferase (cytosine-N4-specific)